MLLLLHSVTFCPVVRMVGCLVALHHCEETVPSSVGSRAAAAKALQVKATRKPQKWEDKGAAKRHTRIGPMLWALTGDTEVSKSLPVRHSSSFKIRAAGVDMKLLGYEQPL